MKVPIAPGCFDHVAFVESLAQFHGERLKPGEVIVAQTRARLFERERFQWLPDLLNLTGIVARKSQDREAAILKMNDEAFFGEDEERFADRPAADAHFRSQGDVGERFAWLKPALDQCPADGVDDAMTHRDGADLRKCSGGHETMSVPGRPAACQL